MVAISPVESKDFRQITKKRYSFDWKKERGVADMFKLTAAGQSDILGLVSVIDFPGEYRLQIHLFCASQENIGRGINPSPHHPISTPSPPFASGPAKPPAAAV